jgi:hypothetical protein
MVWYGIADFSAERAKKKDLPIILVIISRFPYCSHFPTEFLDTSSGGSFKGGQGAP